MQTELRNLQRATGLTQNELAIIFGVSRVSVFGYLCGKKPNHHIKVRIDAATKVLTKLVEQKKLPYAGTNFGGRSPDYNKQKRIANTQKIADYVVSQLAYS